jgi:hypothetical protein
MYARDLRKSKTLLHNRTQWLEIMRLYAAIGSPLSALLDTSLHTYDSIRSHIPMHAHAHNDYVPAHSSLCMHTHAAACNGPAP